MDFNTTATILATIVILYGLYLYKFKYYSVKMWGDYNVKLKNIGTPLPPFPNSWYIAAPSKDLSIGQSKAIDLCGQNITIFRSTKGVVYGLHSYCAHLGANLGVGGEVVNQRCIQCPFHGWLYDGESGLCVNHDGHPLKLKSLQYDDDIGKKGCKSVQWKPSQAEEVKLRKYIVKQMNGYIYIWIHVDPNQLPTFQVINVEFLQQTLNHRGQTIHEVRSHIQDMPQNGADVFHFRYVHKKPIKGISWMNFKWVPSWKRGDDPDLKTLFQHDRKYINKFKNQLYERLVKDHEAKDKLSFANIDNYIILPFVGEIFLFNLTVCQMGPGLVYVFLKTRIFTLLFIQYILNKQPTHQTFYHQVYSSNWLPYWVTASMIYGEGIQVYNDMLIWDSKKFARKIHMKQNSQADEFIKNWRTWVSQFYQGCDIQLQKKNDKMQW